LYRLPRQRINAPNLYGILYPTYNQPQFFTRFQHALPLLCLAIRATVKTDQYAVQMPFKVVHLMVFISQRSCSSPMCESNSLSALFLKMFQACAGLLFFSDTSANKTQLNLLSSSLPLTCLHIDDISAFKRIYQAEIIMVDRVTQHQ